MPFNLPSKRKNMNQQIISGNQSRKVNSTCISNFDNPHRFSRFFSIVGLTVVAAGIAGCAAPPKSSILSSKYSTTQTTTHQYNVTAVDVSGRPVAGVAVEVQLEGKGTSSQNVQCTTDETGRCPSVQYEVTRDPSLTYVFSYSSTAKAKATKDGYYSSSAQGFSSAGSKYGGDGINELRLKLIQPIDYLDDGFAVSVADRELRERVLRFLDVIRLQSVLVDAEVMLKGVGTSEFKGKKYLRLRVNSTTTYNSLKLNKYDMGKRLFDETVRKTLTPLNDNIAAPKAYYGYDIVVYGNTKSFADKYAAAEKVEYRFLLPESAVRRYKQKDISGQALLDAGVQLMNDERVEFKLQ